MSMDEELHQSTKEQRDVFYREFMRRVPHYQPISPELFEECYQQLTAIVVDGELKGGFLMTEGWSIHYGKILDLHIVKVVEDFPTRRLIKHLKEIAKLHGATGIVHSKHKTATRMEVSFIPAGD